MIANMHQRVRGKLANALPQRAGKQNKLVQVAKPFADAAGAATHPPKHGRRTKAFGA